MYTADKSDATPLLPSERKSLGPVAELGRSYKGCFVTHAFFDRLLELTRRPETRKYWADVALMALHLHVGPFSRDVIRVTID